MKIDGVNLIHDSALKDAVVESGTTLPTTNAQDDGRLFFLTQAQGQNPKGLYVYSAGDIEWQFTNDNTDVVNPGYLVDEGGTLSFYNQTPSRNLRLDVTDNESTRSTVLEAIGNSSQPFVILNHDNQTRLSTTADGINVFGTASTATDFLRLRHTGSAGVLDKVGSGILRIRNLENGQDIALDVTDTLGNVTETLRVVGSTTEPYIVLKSGSDDKLRTLSAGVRLYGSTTSEYVDITDGGAGTLLQSFGSGNLNISNRNAGGDMTLNVTDSEGTLHTVFQAEGTTSEPFGVLNYNGGSRFRTLPFGSRIFGDNPTKFMDLTQNGTTAYLQLFGEGTLGIRTRTNSGHLHFGVTNPSGTFFEDMIMINAATDPYVALNHGTDEKMRTIATGVSVVGEVSIDGNTAYHSGNKANWDLLIANAPVAPNGDPHQISTSGVFEVNTVSGWTNIPPGATSGSTIVSYRLDGNDTNMFWLNRDGNVFRKNERNTTWSDWIKIYDSAELEFEEYGGQGVNEVVAIGTAVSATEFRLYLPINFKTAPVGIGVDSTFAIRGLTGADTGNNGITSASFSYSTTISSHRMAVVIIPGMTGLAPGDQYRLQTETATSKLTVFQ